MFPYLTYGIKKINVIAVFILFNSMVLLPIFSNASDQFFEEYLQHIDTKKIKKNILRYEDGSSELKGESRLYWAAVLGLDSTLRDLSNDKTYLEKYAGVALKDSVFAGKRKSINILLKAGADPNSRSDNGNVPIIIASMFGDVEIMKLLISFGANINAKNNEGLDALIPAIVNNKPASVKLLLDSGFDVVNSQTGNGLSAIELATKLGRSEICEMLQNINKISALKVVCF